MKRPSECSICDFLCQRMRHHFALRWRMRKEQGIHVKTWCRICGLPVLLNIIHDYEAAIRFLYGLDDQIACHVDHEEAGGWGRHWRFDEVLWTAFPKESQLADDYYWPTPPWYEHHEAMDQDVRLVSAFEARLFHVNGVDERRLQIEQELNRLPRTREELERETGLVWNAHEVEQEFDILGYRSPFVVAIRRSDNMKGSLIFQHEPRYYFGFEPSRVI